MPKPQPLWNALGHMARELEKHPALLLGADFDGTLCAIHSHPDQVQLRPRVRDALARLAARPQVSVAVFSGRSLDDLRKRVEVPGIFLSGGGGLDSLDEQGGKERHPAAEQTPSQELRESLRLWCERFPGSFIEDKGATLSAHYRSVSRELQGAFRAGLRRRVTPFKSQVRLIHVKKAFEVLPAGTRGKPDAVRAWADRVPGAQLLIYMGDDANDEDCYPDVRERGGITIAVGRVATKAQYGLTHTDEVMWFLEWLDRESDVHAGATAESPA